MPRGQPRPARPRARHPLRFRRPEAVSGLRATSGGAQRDGAAPRDGRGQRQRRLRIERREHGRTGFQRVDASVGRGEPAVGRRERGDRPVIAHRGAAPNTTLRRVAAEA